MGLLTYLLMLGAMCLPESFRNRPEATVKHTIIESGYITVRTHSSLLNVPGTKKMKGDTLGRFYRNGDHVAGCLWVCMENDTEWLMFVAEQKGRKLMVIQQRILFPGCGLTR